MVEKLLTYNQIEKVLEDSFNKIRVNCFFKNKCFSCEKKRTIKLYKFVSMHTGEIELLPNCLICIEKWKVTCNEVYYEINEQELFLVRLLC